MTNKMRIINLTPHALHIHRADGTDIVVEPSGCVPRLAVSRSSCMPVICEDGVEVLVTRAKFGALDGMLAPRHGVVYVVSALCAQSPEMAERDDVYAPGEAIRDDAGKIVGSEGLSYISPVSAVRI